jgi:hypothetical protein
MGLLYGCAGHLTAIFGCFRPGQVGKDRTGRLGADWQTLPQAFKV